MMLAASIVATLISSVSAPQNPDNPMLRGTDLVQASLVADREAVYPGESFTLGVRFEIEPGWHLYWKNPGDSGRTVQIAYSNAVPSSILARSMAEGPEILDDAVRLKRVEYPAPTRALTLPGDIVNYIYEDEVVLLLEADVPWTNLTPGKQLRIEIDCEWLVCDEICLIGRDTVELVLPVVAKKDELAGREVNQELFDRARARVPAPLPESLGARAEWSGTRERPVFSIAVDGARELELFPLEGDSGFRLTGLQHARAGDRHSAELSYRVRKKPGSEHAARAVMRVVGQKPDAPSYYLIDHALPRATYLALPLPE